MNEVGQQVASNWWDGSWWVIVVFIGAFVLFGAIVWSRQKNKGITPEEHRRSEEATRANYQDPVDHDPEGR
jgi:hypothetical protein